MSSGAVSDADFGRLGVAASEVIGQTCREALFANGEVLQLEIGEGDPGRREWLGQWAILVPTTWQVVATTGGTLESIDEQLSVLEDVITDFRLRPEDMGFDLFVRSGFKLEVRPGTSSSYYWELFLPTGRFFRVGPGRFFVELDSRDDE